MSSMSSLNVQEYYRKITDQDIGAVAQELLGSAVTEVSSKTLLCDCPNHQSQSKRSFHVMLDKQGWYCHGCRVGGDVLQLVEFIQSKCVTSKVRGKMPDSHRMARDYLAKRIGLNKLGGFDASAESVELAEANYALDMSARSVLVELAKLYNQRLKAAPDVLSWLKKNYATNDKTIDDLLIGYSNNDDGTYRVLKAAPFNFSHKELLSSGAFIPKPDDEGGFAFFEKRIIFPYWSRGSIGFMIARKTPWTPKNKFESGKYKKLRVHSHEKATYIARCIDNSILYNEDCLISKPNYVVITEGVTDCIALMQQGIPTISPVTVRIKEDDWDRIVSKLGKINKIYLCQDNEISQVGLQGALESAHKLAAVGIDTRIVTLPLMEKQIQARKELCKILGATSELEINELLKRNTDLPEEKRKYIEKLLLDSKIDVNEYFTLGKTQEDFQQLLNESKSIVEYTIEQIPIDISDFELEKKLMPIIQQISKYHPLQHTSMLRLIKEHLGKQRITMSTLQKLLQGFKREKFEKPQKKQDPFEGKSQEYRNSCSGQIELLLMESKENGNPDYIGAAEIAYKWFKAQGAQFYRNKAGHPIMCFESDIFYMDSNDHGRKRLYAAMFFKHTNLLLSKYEGRIISDVLANLAITRGIPCEQFSWIFSDVGKCTVWFNLNNAEHEIVRISPNDVQVLQNGNNLDSVMLSYSDKSKPFKYKPDVNLAEADKLIGELFLNNLTCEPELRLLVYAWLSCFLLIDFSGTKPMTRFEGPAGSGKTTASKLLSTIIFGQPQHKVSTDAANYSDGTRNPVVLLDNIEVKQMTDELITFMLTSITGVLREKRRGGTDTETVTERTRCLVNTTGIEPLCGELTEILSRTLTFNFDSLNQTDTYFLESMIIAKIQEHRDTILSAIIKRTSYALALIQNGDLGRIMNLLQVILKDHDKRRCNDYLSLMYLMMYLDVNDGIPGIQTDKLDENFLNAIRKFNSTSQETARISNPIASLLHSLFDVYGNLLRLDDEARMRGDLKTNHVDAFIEKYQITFKNANEMNPLWARELLKTLNRFAADYRLPFSLKGVTQLAKRLTNDQKIIEDSGLKIEVTRDCHFKTNRYTVSKR